MWTNGNINRSRSEYTEQLISDIASYYGYNEFLAEKLFELFSVSEVYKLGSEWGWNAKFILGYRIL
jgi:hypothetical protein